MQTDNLIPLSVVKLLIAYFSHTITETEKLQLDDWICATQNNMKIFGECLQITLFPFVSDPERDQNDADTNGPINMN